MNHTILFGDSKSPLYGVFHPPYTSTKGPESAALLCYPVGHEYLRSHWAFRMLANSLAKNGVAAFRFDYYGTGDSAGKSEEGDFSIWIENVKSASEELKAMTGLKKVTAIGLRIGCTIISKAADEGFGFHRHIYWDPVMDSNRYFQQIKYLHKKTVTSVGRTLPPRTGNGYVEIMGFPYPDKLIDHISEYDLLGATIRNTGENDVIIHSNEKDFNYREGEPIPGGLRRVLIEDAGDWGNYQVSGKALLPAAIINAIVKEISSRD
jgi:uncharacterized protein